MVLIVKYLTTMLRKLPEKPVNLYYETEVNTFLSLCFVNKSKYYFIYICRMKLIIKRALSSCIGRMERVMNGRGQK